MVGRRTFYLGLGNTVGSAIAGLLISFGYGIPFWVAGILTLLTAWFALNLNN